MFKLSESCPKVIVFQALEGGDYDYSEFGSEQAAWDYEQSQAWVKDNVEHYGRTLESCRKEFLKTLTIATPEEALKAAKDGYGWPLGLGFVEEVED